MIDALGGIVTLGFDLNNNLLNLIDPVGNETQWTCDALTAIPRKSTPSQI